MQNILVRCLQKIQHIHSSCSGHLIAKCEANNIDKYLQIIGFVEAAEKCPADKYSYTTPYTHPLTKTLQAHVTDTTPLVSFDKYEQNLSVSIEYYSRQFQVFFIEILLFRKLLVNGNMVSFPLVSIKMLRQYKPNMLHEYVK